VPPEKNGDYAFLLHILASLKSIGKGAVILPHGVLFRGNAEAEIREKIVSHGYIQGIIGLPANLFYSTDISAFRPASWCWTRSMPTHAKAFS
jgi:type I restriction enzyme M protein